MQLWGGLRRERGLCRLGIHAQGWSPQASAPRACFFLFLNVSLRADGDGQRAAASQARTRRASAWIRRAEIFAVRGEATSPSHCGPRGARARLSSSHSLRFRLSLFVLNRNRFDQFRIAHSERQMGAVSGPNNTACAVLVDVQSSRQSCGLPRVGNDETVQHTRRAAVSRARAPWMLQTHTPQAIQRLTGARVFSRTVI